MNVTKNTSMMCLILAMVLLVSGCANKAQDGAATGALLGATVGALTANNKVTGALIGAGVGMMLGYIVGNEMDKMDQQQMNNTLEYSPSGQTSSWNNPDTGYSYEATPQPAYMEKDVVYRDVDIVIENNGEKEIVQAKAYRKDDGTWEFVQQ